MLPCDPRCKILLASCVLLCCMWLCVVCSAAAFERPEIPKIVVVSFRVYLKKKRGGENNIYLSACCYRDISRGRSTRHAVNLNFFLPAPTSFTNSLHRQRRREFCAASALLGCVGCGAARQVNCAASPRCS